MTNISICDQFVEQFNSGRQFTRDGQKVAVRYRDKDGFRAVDYYDVPAQFFVDPTDFCEKGEWVSGEYVRFDVPQPIGGIEDVMDFLQNHRNVISVENNAAESIDGKKLLRVKVHSRSHVRTFNRQFTPIYGADMDQQDLCLINNNISCTCRC